LVGTVAHAEQSGHITSEKSSSAAVLKESVKGQTNNDEKPKNTVSQPWPHIQAEERLVQQEIKKVRTTPAQEKVAQHSESPTFTFKSKDQVPKDSAINKQKIIPNKSGSIQSRASVDALVNKPNNTTQGKSKTVIADKQTKDAIVLDNSEIIVVAPKAKNVDLEKPISESDILSPETIRNTKPTEKDESVKEVDSATKVAEPDFKVQTDNKVHDKPFLLLGAEVSPGTSTRLSWSPSQSFQGIAVPTPVLVVNGVKPGPVLCLTAAVHGDELNGIEMVRRVLYNLEVKALSGTVIGVPIVNLQGFRRSSRYLSDRRDLNRFFPGDPKGSSASRIAYSFFHEIISHCNALVDLHTGSFHRTNLPQLRADLSNPDVVDITQGFGATVILQSDGAKGTLRRAAIDAGIPAVTLEAGEPMRLQEDQVSHGVKGIQTLMNKLGMYDYSSFWGDPEPVYYKSKWVRADQGGILFSQVNLGEKVKPGESLGTVTDPITNVRSELVSPYQGRVIGMALNQVVMPGFAAFHIGIKSTEKEITQTGGDMNEDPINHTSGMTVDDERNVAKSKEKILELDKRDSLVDSE
jgi:predicted deacylase